MATVAPVNSNPTATGDTLNANQNTVLNFDAALLLANDTDPDGDSLRITGFTQPTNGTITDNGNGTYSYTPTAGFTGTDSFSYTVDDGNGGMATANVTINVAAAATNANPVANNDNANTRKNRPVVINGADLLANDTDADGDTLTITGFTQPNNGTITDNGDGTFTYTPDDGFSGTDSFSYTVDDGNGGTSTATVNIVVADNTDPNATDDSVTADADTALTINATDLLANDTDADGDALSIVDITQPANGSLVDNGNGTYTYTPNSGFSGTDSFNYTVDDGNGGTSTATVNINVNAPAATNTDPSASDDSLSGAAGAVITFAASDLLANDTDADGDTLSITGFTQPSNGSIVDNGNGTYSYTPDAGFSGSDSFSYTIDDGNGGTSTANVNILVTNTNTDPNAVNDSVSVDAGSALTINAADLLANDTDADGDTLSITGITQPANGSLVDNGNGTYTYTPDAGFSGSDSFSYTVDDGNGGTSTATVDINVNAPAPTNTDPNAVDDSVTVDAGATLVINAADLLANDTDADGDTLSITGITQPANGSLVDNGNGTYSYTPDAGFSGSDSFSYTVDDGNGGTSTATVDINVNAPAPTNTDPNAVDDSVTVDAGATLVINAADLLANDTDADGDTLSITGITQPANGSLVDNGNGTYSYTPDAGFSGSDSFSYTVDDGNGGTSTATVDINVNAPAPTNTDPNAVDDSVTVDAGATLVINAADLLANDTDADGDTLSITGITQPANGSLVDNGNGTYSYTPDAGFSGSDSFSYTVDDGNGGTSTATVDINVNAPAPTNTDPNAVDDSLSVERGQSLDFSAADLLANDTDIDGDNLSIISVSDPANGTLTDNGNGTYTYNPNSGFTGSDSFVYTIDDGNGGTSTASVDINVYDSNNDPSANDDNLTADSGVAYTFSAADLLGNDSDTDGDTLSITGFDQPDHGTLVDNGNGTYTYTSDNGFTGEDQFKYYISDGKGGDDNATVKISVNDVNGTPTANDDSLSGNENADLTFTTADLLGNDVDPDGDNLSIVGFSDPNNGSLIDNGNGTYTYRPNSGFTGTDSFSYTIDDGNGGTSTANVNVLISNVNDNPNAQDDTLNATEDTQLTFAVADLLANDSDPDGDALNLASINQPANGTLVDNGNGTFTYNPNANFNGTDSFSYTVDDGNGGTSTATVNIVVSGVNDDPVANNDSLSATEDTPLSFNASDLLANDTDTDGDNLTITSITAAANGTVVDNGNGTFTYTADAGFSGSDSFSYTIDDGNGGTSTATVDINVSSVNDDPNAMDDVFTGTEDTALIISAADLLANDTDADGDSLSITGFSQPNNGSLIDNGDGTYTYNPTANFSGSDDFTYTVDDGNGGTSTATVTLNINNVNDGPTAGADSFSTDENTAITFSLADILSNDTDLDGDNLTLDSMGLPANGTLTDNGNGTYTYNPNQGYSGTDSFNYTISDGNGGTATGTIGISVNDINFAPDVVDDSLSTTEDTPLTFTAADLLGNDSDLDGDTLTIASFTQPNNGSITDNNDGTYTFTPNSNFNGVASFEYTAEDGNGASATGTVNIDVASVNDGPTAGDDFFATDENTAVTFSLADILSNDDDADGDSLTLDSIGVPANGTLTDNGDGTYTYNPNQGYSGTDSFSYTISDGNGGTATGTISIGVNDINFAPDVVDDTLSATEDTPLTFTAADLLGNDTDLDGDTLTIASFTQPNNGSITDNGNGTYTFTPDSNFNGSTHFRYTVEDGHGGSSTGRVNVDVAGVNDGPTANDDSLSTDEQTPLTFGVDDLLGNDSDVDGGNLSITGFTQPTNGTLTDNGDGTYTYNPNAGFYGSDSFQYTVSDGQGGSTTATVNVNVNDVNVNPNAVDDTLTATEDTPLIIDPSIFLANDTDADGDTLQVTGFRQPDHGTLTDNGDGTWTYTPDSNFTGSDSFQYTVNDGHGGQTRGTVNVSVGNVNDAPTVQNDQLTTDEDNVLTFSTNNLLGNDSDIDGDAINITGFSQPGQGTIVDNGDGTFSYTPNFNYSGSDSFTYTVTDANGATSTGTVDITVNDVEDVFDRLPGVRSVVDTMLAEGIINADTHATLMAKIDEIEAAPDLETANRLLDEFFVLLNEVATGDITNVLLGILAPGDLGVMDQYINSMMLQLVLQMSQSVSSFGQSTIKEAFAYVEEEEEEKRKKEQEGGKFA